MLTYEGDIGQEEEYSPLALMEPEHQETEPVEKMSDGEKEEEEEVGEKSV